MDGRIVKVIKEINLANLLSFKERQILRSIKNGYTNKEIGESLNLTEGTIKVYNHAIFQKLQVKSRTQAVQWMHKHDLL